MIKRYNKGTILLWLIIACGGIVFLFSARQVVSSGLSKDALLLCVATLAFSILGSVKIPGVKINLTVSDGFVLTSVLFFGIPTATLLGFADAFLASLRITRSNSKRAFNAAAMGLSVFCSANLTGWFHPAFFAIRQHQTAVTEIAFPIALLGLFHYCINSSIVSTVVALRTEKPVLRMWRDDLLWTSISYFTGATVAGLVYVLISKSGFHTFVVAVPIAIITHLSYKTYLSKVETSRQQAARLEELFTKVSKGKREWEVTFDSLAEAIYIFDEIGHLIRLNKGAQQLEARLRGNDCFITDLPGSEAFSLGIFESAENQQNFIRAQAGQEISFESRLRDSSSEGIDLAITATAVEFDVFEEKAPLLVVVRDITEQKRLRQQLMQAEKMSAVGELVSGVAHELNNPLTTVIGFSQLLHMSGNLDENDQNDLNLIISEAERAREIVANLLTFARQTHSEKACISLNEVIEKVLMLRAYHMRTSNIDVKQNLDPQLPLVLGNFHQLQQVLLNIIVNAEQAMLETSKKGSLSIVTRAHNGKVVVEIADDGPGIESANLNRIFDPFFTTKAQGKGTGLGLSISYGIVREHSGEIFVSSVLNQGTAFIIHLPAVEQDREVETPDDGIVVDTSTKLRILVVDDESGIVRFLGRALNDRGHHCDATQDVDTALELLASKSYDIVLSDVRMAGKDGPAFFREAVALDETLTDRFVFMTGDAVSTKTSGFLESINATYISKPFDIVDLMNLIQSKISADYIPLDKELVVNSCQQSADQP